ncbi:MAG: tetratricopeptide repeat protein [Dehalococcoidia bacterium]
MDLAQGALIASGVNEVREFNSYMAKIDQLCQEIAHARKAAEVERAKEIFHWLWKSKPHRYQQRGNFKLNNVIDAQLGETETVGNCLGLTVLFNVLTQSFGLEVKAVHLEYAFGIGPHVFTVLHAGSRSIDIEHSLPYGFDYHGHKGTPQREEWEDRELVADIYHSVANSSAELGEWADAIEGYDKAIRLNPEYSKARLNKGIALVELGRVEEAREWLKEKAPAAPGGA